VPAAAKPIVPNQEFIGMNVKENSVNAAGHLSEIARLMPEAVAVAEPLDYDPQGKRHYRRITFQKLDQDSDRIARGLREMGVTPGTRLALMVRPGIDFISLVLAIFKVGAVAILIDPGMGRRSLIRCLAEAKPQGFIAIPLAQAIRTLLPGRFPESRFHVTVGRRWFWDGVTLEEIRNRSWQGSELAPMAPEDPAAIIFTTGSTGPPKGVLYCHGNFITQANEIRDFYGIRPGEIDVPCFPLFGLFNCVLGVTAVIPDMNPSRPAQVDPAKIIEAIEDWKANQTFGSPAVWNRVGQYCRQKGIRMPTVRRVLSSGAPVAADILECMKACIHPEGEIYTPYGATEALPVASISSSEVLLETAAKTRRGEGVCVGCKFPSISWKVIRIVDGPIPSIAGIQELPQGEIGELIVQGPVVTRQYVTRLQSNALGKIQDNGTVWHRMGDTGYLDGSDRFWFCGRVAHRVLTANGPMYPICCEAIFKEHPAIYRSALVGVGPANRQRPVIVLEPKSGKMPAGRPLREALLEEMRQMAAGNALTSEIKDFLLHPAFPVDIRHNAKIFREKLALWAEKQVARERRRG
jgi:olefin beta-lactone synthetase